LPQLQRGKYPLLENLQVYNKAISTEKDIDDLLSEYKKTINKVLQAIRSWTWNDPVSSMYANLFDESVIVDPDFDRDKLSKELKRRNIHKIPPGYKDSSKDDKGIGDLLIWFTILQIGKNNNKSIIFVSGDEKADWWYQSQGRSLYPRFELVDEFRRHSKGKSFHIVSFSMLLDTYGASPDVISEVREKESQSLSEMTHGELHILELCQQGYTNSEIADITGLSSGTVRNYLSKIYSKLDARNRVEAIQSAIEAEILDPFAVDDSKINKIKSRSTQEIMMRQMDISARELEILELMKLGLTNNEISAKLNIGEGTTRNYTSSIYNKLDVRNKVEAIQEAIEIGLIPPIAE
jgi:DNA-binding NarL/FixJ family response regulator